MLQPPEITQFISGQPLSGCRRARSRKSQASKIPSTDVPEKLSMRAVPDEGRKAGSRGSLPRQEAGQETVGNGPSSAECRVLRVGARSPRPLAAARGRLARELRWRPDVFLDRPPFRAEDFEPFPAVAIPRRQRIALARTL